MEKINVGIYIYSDILNGMLTKAKIEMFSLVIRLIILREGKEKYQHTL